MSLARTATIVTAAALLLPASAIAAPKLAGAVPTARTTAAATTTTTTTTTTSTTSTQPPIAPQNLSSARVALNAYAAYLDGMLQAAPVGQVDESSYIAAISDQCRSALEPLTQPSYQLDQSVQHTLTAIGREIGSDLSITFDQAALPAFTKLTDTLRRLHWARGSGAAEVVRRFINTQTNVLYMTTSDLCQDALYAAETPKLVPSGTKAFMHSYNRASMLANVALENFLKLLQSDELPRERGLVARIANLATEVLTLSRSQVLQSGSLLSTALETT